MNSYNNTLIMKHILLALAITTVTTTLTSAAVITMKWEGTISGGSAPFVTGDPIGGTYAIDDSIVGTPGPGNPALMDYYGPVSLTVSSGSYAWHTVDQGIMQVFDNSQNNPTEIPRDVLVVAGLATGSQIDAHDISWMRLYMQEWGISLTEPPTVITSVVFII